VHNHPVICFFVPDCNFLNLLKFILRNEIFNNQVFKLELVSQLVNSVIHVISFPVKIIRRSIEHFLSFIQLSPQLRKLLSLELKLFLDAVELVLGVQEVILLLFQLLLQVLFLLIFDFQLLLGLF
jgi:hypothetical protein